MSEASAFEMLEEALFARARALADEYRTEGRRRHEAILKDADEKLRRWEEREKRHAQSLAQRTFRQRVERGELKLQAKLDRFRWNSIQTILDKSRERLMRLVEDEARYLPVLGRLLAEAAANIGSDELIVHLNERDLKRLRSRWELWCKEYVPDKRLALSPDPFASSGGVLVETAQGDIRMDNTFDGRIERLQEVLQRVIAERLFGSVERNSVPSHG